MSDLQTIERLERQHREQAETIGKYQVELAFLRQRLAAAEQGKPKAFYASKFDGQGFGGASDCRVIVRRERKGLGRTWITIVDDEGDTSEIAFRPGDAPQIIDAINRAVESLKPSPPSTPAKET